MSSDGRILLAYRVEEAPEAAARLLRDLDRQYPAREVIDLAIGADRELIDRVMRRLARLDVVVLLTDPNWGASHVRPAPAGESIMSELSTKLSRAPGSLVSVEVRAGALKPSPRLAQTDSIGTLGALGLTERSWDADVRRINYEIDRAFAKRSDSAALTDAETRESAGRGFTDAGVAGESTTPVNGRDEPLGSPAGGLASRNELAQTNSRESGGGSRLAQRYWWAALGVVLLVGAGVAVASGAFSSPNPPSGQQLSAAARPVPTNHVTGSGSATVALRGNRATVTLRTVGLLNGSPHLIHIHAAGLGVCPPASAARLHNGHLAISTGNGTKYYGPPEVALTTRGNTSPKSNLAFNRAPFGGTIRYRRTVTVTPAIASLIRGGNAVIVVHGIDYDHSGTYDEVLGPSDLAPQFTGDSTAPALCGHLASGQTTVAATRQPSQGMIYTASLALYRPGQADELDASSPQTEATAAFALYCHLAGRGAPAIASRGSTIRTL